MEVEVVNCEAPTVEKKGYNQVDCQAPTVEKMDRVNPVAMTKLRPCIMTLRYRKTDELSKIIPFLPRNPIEKSIAESVNFGRTQTFDVFLNDECMSRNYAKIYPDRYDPCKFRVENCSQSKLVVVDNKQLSQNDTCWIQDKSTFQLDIITFDVSLQCGDKNADKYVIKVEPGIDFNSLPNIQMQNFCNCNLTCHIPTCPNPTVGACLGTLNSPSPLNLSHHHIINPIGYLQSNVPLSSSSSIPASGKSSRQPQEHSMPPEDPVYSEKQKQYRYIEELSRNKSFGDSF